MLYRWQAGGPYRVSFSTRLGGVSEGPYASLNLGASEGDAPERVLENRARLCAELEIDCARATMANQQHGTRALEARQAGLCSQTSGFPECDSLWSAEPGKGMLLVTADCLPIAMVSGSGKPTLALAHAGWRGLLGGVVEAAARAFGGRPFSAAIGPAIGPCCFEVSEEIADSFRGAFGSEVAAGRMVDLWLAAERALVAAGCRSVERFDICTVCHPELFFSHRRERGLTGRQGVIGVIG